MRKNDGGRGVKTTIPSKTPNFHSPKIFLGIRSNLIYRRFTTSSH
jgi:hypothetical protein